MFLLVNPLRNPAYQLSALSDMRATVCGLTPRCARPSTALGLRVRNDRENCWRHSHVPNSNDDSKLGSQKESLYLSNSPIIMVQLLTLSLGLSSYFQCNIKSTATQAFSPSAHITPVGTYHGNQRPRSSYRGNTNSTKIPA